MSKLEFAFQERKAVLELLRESGLTTPVPGPITANERAYFFLEGRDRFRFKGAFVELGAFLGASTQAFAAGLKANPAFSENPDYRMDVFDLFFFDASWGGDSVFSAYGIEGNEDFKGKFEQNVHDFAPMLRTHQGDILQVKSFGKEIETLFIDLAKTQDILAHIVDVFFPKLQVGARVIHQDYLAKGLPFIKVFMEHFKKYFTEERPDCGCTVTYTLRRKWDVPTAEANAVYGLSTADKVKLLQKAAKRFGPTYKDRFDYSINLLQRGH